MSWETISKKYKYFEFITCISLGGIGQRFGSRLRNGWSNFSLNTKVRHIKTSRKCLVFMTWGRYVDLNVRGSCLLPPSDIVYQPHIRLIKHLFQHPIEFFLLGLIGISIDTAVTHHGFYFYLSTRKNPLNAPGPLIQDDLARAGMLTGVVIYIIKSAG